MQPFILTENHVCKRLARSLAKGLAGVAATVPNLRRVDRGQAHADRLAVHQHVYGVAVEDRDALDGNLCTPAWAGIARAAATSSA